MPRHSPKDHRRRRRSGPAAGLAQTRCDPLTACVRRRWRWP